MIRSMVLLIATVLAGCDLFETIKYSAYEGTDGEDGEAFIAYSWRFDDTTFGTADPALSESGEIINGNYVQTDPGEYSFDYTAWDGSYWSGSYTIYINEGWSGGWFFDGPDGVDNYFELLCYSVGPSFRVQFSPTLATLKAESAPSADDQHFKELSRGAVESSSVDEHSAPIIPLVERTSSPEDGHHFRQVVEAGQYTVVLEFSAGGK